MVWIARIIRESTKLLKWALMRKGDFETSWQERCALMFYVKSYKAVGVVEIFSTKE